MNTLTVTPILLALVLGLVLQGTNIYDFHKRQVGTLEIRRCLEIAHQIGHPGI